MRKKTKTNSMDGVIEAIDNLFPNPRRLKKALNATLYSVGQKINRLVSSDHPWTDRSGLLNRSHYIRRPRLLQVKIGNSAPYSRFLHDGTGIYGPKKQPIVAKKADNLRFKIGDRWIATRSVKGVKPMRWLTKAWEKELPSTIKHVEKTILDEMGF